MGSEVYRLVFEIPYLTKMQNAIGRRHWTAKLAEANKVKRMVWHAVGTKTPKEPLKAAEITLTRFSTNEPDFDGLVSGFKHILDALTECKVIVNDKQSTIGQPKYGWKFINKGYGKMKVEVVEKTSIGGPG